MFVQRRLLETGLSRREEHTKAMDGSARLVYFLQKGCTRQQSSHESILDKGDGNIYNLYILMQSPMAVPHSHRLGWDLTLET